MTTKNRHDHSDRSRGLSRREFVKLVGVTTAGLMVGCGSSHHSNSTLALINGTLIDGTGAEPLVGGAVVIRGDRIVSTGLSTQVEVPANADIIDVQGGTILPGFINVHVHNVYEKETLKAWARGGVTTVRDMGADEPDTAGLFGLRDALRTTPECARLVAVGSFVNVEGGYPIVYLDEYAITVTSPAEARQAVNRLVDAGADVIKTAFESGYAFAESGWPLLTPEEATALVEAAHERGKLVSAHVTSALDLERALDAGVDEIAHMVVDTLPEDLIARTVESGTRWVPTLELWEGVSSEFPVPHGTRAIENLALCLAAGAEIAVGTDYDGVPYIDFDLGMPIREIELMKEAGMTPMQIIVAATRNGARSCNMETELGTLEAGKLADVLVVDGDPLADIHAFTNPCVVLREGKVIYYPGHKSAFCA
jgi:imidazolonepropionase-like amidohydrolase